MFSLLVGCEAFIIPHTRHSGVSFEHYQQQWETSRLQSTANDNVESRSGNPKSQSISTRQLAMQALTAPPANRKKALENFSPISRLESSPQFLNLEDQRDKSFARHLVSTTMRRMGQIDSILNHVCDVYPPRGKGKQSLILQAVSFDSFIHKTKNVLSMVVPILYVFHLFLIEGSEIGSCSVNISRYTRICCCDGNS